MNEEEMNKKRLDDLWQECKEALCNDLNTYIDHLLNLYEEAQQEICIMFKQLLDEEPEGAI